MNALHDARPFVDLRKDAEEFRLKFEEDIRRCLAHLNSKITALVCDPDSTGHHPSTGVRQNALLEFAKMKYDIFVSVSSQFNEMEREWLKYIAEMKKLFIENIEIFLAGTKLEVKFPTNAENKSRTRTTEGAKSVASSIYPVFNSIAKSISAFGSPGSKNETGEELQKIVEPRTADSFFFSRRDRLSSVTPCSPVLKLKACKSDSPVYDKHFQKMGMPSHDNSADGLSESSTPEVVDLIDDEDGMDQVYESANNSLNHSEKQLAQEEEDRDISEETEREEIIPPVKTRGRKVKKGGRRKKDANASAIPSENIEPPPDNPDALGDENADNIEETEEDNIPIFGFLPPVKARRGRKPGWRKTINQTIEQNAFGNENAGNIGETEENSIPPVVKVKARRGRKPGWNKNINQTIDAEKKNMVEENAPAHEPESMPVLKTQARGRGRPRTVFPVTKTAEEVTASNKDIAPAVSKVSTKNRVETGDMDMYRDVESTDVRNPYGEDDEERDEFVSAAKSRYISQRKTLGPQDFPDFDDAPAPVGKGIFKRKTFAGLSEVSASPSKKLKAGGKKSLLPTKSKDDTTDNSSESGNFTEWLRLRNIDGTVPPAAGVYEVKVNRAKKSAYIGFCESLRQKLTCHKLKENSGHKQLDKWLERNYNDVLVRYEVMPSEAEAKSVAKDRVGTFVSMYNTTPAYN